MTGNAVREKAVEWPEGLCRPVPDEPGSHISLDGGDAFTLDVWGYLPPGWLGRLASGLSHSRIGIVRGKARKATAVTWNSSFQIERAGEADPLAVDYLALASGRMEVPPGSSLVLHDYVLERSRNVEGTLYAEVSGPDRIGFLVSILKIFSFYSLFPVEMLVETEGGRVFDRFWLKGIGGSVPTPESCRLLKESLDALLREGGKKF